MTPQEIYEAAIKKYGENAQLLMLLEEMSELSTEVCHLLRGRADLNIVEEYADLIIMLDQFEMIVEKKIPTFKDDAMRMYYKKLDRLKTRVEC